MKRKTMGRMLGALLAAVLTVGVCLAAQSGAAAEGVQWLTGSVTGWAENDAGEWMYYVNGEPVQGLRTDLPGYEGEAFIFDTDGTLITTSLGEGWTPRDTGSAGPALPGQEDTPFPGGESFGGGLGSMFGGGNFWRTMALVELAIIVVLLVKPEKKEPAAPAESAGEEASAENTAENGEAEE